MSRFLLGGMLLLIAMATVYSLGTSSDVVERLEEGTRASRDAISANPAAAQDLSPLEQAGRNVTRQTSPDGLAQAPNATPASPAPAQTAPAQTAPAQSPGTPQPVAAPGRQPIPALW